MTALRFVLTLPRSLDGRQSTLEIIDAPADWKEASGPCLWLSEPTAVLSLDDDPRSLLIGSVFARAGGQELRQSDWNRMLVQGASTRARAEALLHKAWGAYLLLQREPSGAWSLLRDPLGQLPAYHLATPSHHIIISDAPLLREAGLPRPGIDWLRLDQHLRWPDLRAWQTCLVGLRECRPGALLSAEDQAELKVIDQLWSPWAHAEAADVRRPASPEQLRAVACDTVAAWIRDEPHVVVAASGGLDSSIVCAALAAAKTPFTCVTLATSDPSGDERPYVRKLADHFNVAHVERCLDPAAIDLAVSTSAHLPRPSRKLFKQPYESALRATAQAAGAHLILDGNGGDNLFCFLHASLPAVDRLRSEGLTRGFVSTLLDMCRLTQCDVRTMSMMVLRHRLGLTMPKGWSAKDQFLTGDGAGLPPPACVTPHLERSGGLPGKRAHIDLLTRMQNHLDGFEPGAPAALLSPLISQPLVELCLGVPSWQWCEGGINRSHARKAFAGDLPRSVTERVSKAGPETLLIRFFEVKRAQLRERLLDGLLAHHGLLDRPSIEAAFADPRIDRDGQVSRLLDLAEAESWARSWHM